MLQTILGAIASCVVVIVTAYFGVRGDVRERAALKELVELHTSLAAESTASADTKKQLQDEIERRVKALAPTSDQVAQKAQRKSVWWPFGIGVVFYAGALFTTGITTPVHPIVVALVFVALPVGALFICAGAISGLRYWRRYQKFPWSRLR